LRFLRPALCLSRRLMADGCTDVTHPHFNFLLFFQDELPLRARRFLTGRRRNRGVGLGSFRAKRRHVLVPKRFSAVEVLPTHNSSPKCLVDLFVDQVDAIFLLQGEFSKAVHRFRVKLTWMEWNPVILLPGSSHVERGLSPALFLFWRCSKWVVNPFPGRNVGGWD